MTSRFERTGDTAAGGSRLLAISATSPGRVALLAALFCALYPSAAGAEEAEAAPLPLAPVLAQEGPWRPPAQAPDEKDWLELTSGEWVRGEIDLITDEVVHFDSDELDDLEIDREDVASLVSARRNTYRFNTPFRLGRSRFDNVIVTGSAGMRDGVIRIDTGDEVREFPRDDLISMIEGDLREINYWSLEISLGLTVRSGNSDQQDGSGQLQLERETPLTDLLLAYASATSVVEGEEITDNQRATGQFSIYVTRRFFLIAPTVEAFRDRIQNIDLRATIGAGVGYDILDRPRVEWDVILGGGYQRTAYDRVEPGEPSAADDAAVIVRSTLELDPWKDVDWDTTYQLQAIVTDLAKTNHHLSSVVSVDIWGPLDLDVSFAWDRIEGPTRDAAGELPERDDFRLTVGLGLDL
jgi:putative salt-induced outer membrane protein YdiY